MLVLSVLVGLWAVVFAFTFVERGFTLERAREQLQITVITLADFNELAEQAEDIASDTRTDALWRALLQYPAASIWVEAGGEVTGGLPAENLEAAILVEESRANFTVFAALPESEALADWQRSLLVRGLALVAVSIAFLVLTHYLVQALRQRSVAEREAAATQERNTQLTYYRTQLEDTVAARTSELKVANTRLEVELTERKVAEQTLQQHDALLSAVTKGAAELLGSHKHEDAINAVLELIGQTLAVSRVQLNVIVTGSDGHLRSSIAHEWNAPGLNVLMNDPRFQNMDISLQFPKSASLLVSGTSAAFYIDEIPAPYQAAYAAAGMRSFLKIPVQVENKSWGCVTFIDSATQQRQWSWAETDTLRTLAGLIGVAMTRARYVKELADANMIVQNSPTILYRLKGEPAFPLIYISHNITKFGHKSGELVEAGNWMETLVAPEDRETVHKAMSRMLEPGGSAAALEFRLRSGDGDYRWVENRYTPVRDKNGRLVEVEGIIIDITERKAAEEKIAAMARTDGLTGLANRVTFNERLNLAFAASRRGANPFAVMYMDLDHFKTINDTLGHGVGDELLKEVANRLRKVTRNTDLVARLGGDEFAVLQMEISEPANAGTLAQNILQAINRPMQIEGNELRVTSSLGICPYSEDSVDPDNMLIQADLALYRAKDEGRNRFRFHSGELDKLVLERTEMAEELRQAIEKGELELAYQPQVTIAGGTIVGLEALLRWNHPTRGLLVAKDFISVAEKTGSIMDLGHWVLDTACRQLRAWRDAGMALTQITLNLSALQLKSSSELVRDVAETTRKWGLQPSDLEFDVTEAMLAETTWSHNEVLNLLRQLGCKIAIDNFGTEYSSFEYLRAYEVNHLKLGQIFIRRALKDPEWGTAIRAIINLARDLGIGVVVEGVETREQLELLQSIGITADAQGYYYSRAVTGVAASELLRVGHVSIASANQPGGEPASPAPGPEVKA
jgi:diguanylate cyclase (GGDEF)-like protein/PAS domain S-box-containing protein